MKKRRSRKGISVTVKRAAWQVKWERGAKSAWRAVFHALAVIGFITVIVLIARAL